MTKKIRSTTIIGVRHKGGVAMAGDGQVTFGEMAFKQKAVKVREFKIAQKKVLGGFAGAAADALTLFEKFEHTFDLIIDDGLHLESSNLLILKHGLDKLSPKGCMIIEDIGQSALKTWIIVSNLLQTKYSSLIIDREGLGYCFIVYKN